MLYCGHVQRIGGMTIQQFVEPSRASTGAARVSYAQALLERGLKVSSVATMISAKFSVARSTAYVDIQAANKTIQESDDGPDTSEMSDPVSPLSIQAQLVHMIDVAAAVGDGKTVAQLIKSLDTVKRWGGYAPESISPFT